MSLINSSLIEAGYLDVHEAAYRENAFVVQAEMWFELGKGFPCLTPNSVPAGIQSASYSVALSACAPFMRDAAFARNLVREGLA